MVLVVLLLAAGVCVSIFSHPLLLWQRRQQLINQLRLRESASATDSLFGDDPTCFIEHFPLRAVLVTWLFDLCDLLFFLLAQMQLSVPLFDAQRLVLIGQNAPRSSALVSSMLLGLVSAPVSGFVLWVVLRVHLLPRTARSVWPSFRWFRAPADRLLLLRTVAIVAVRDFLYCSTMLMVVLLLSDQSVPILLTRCVAVLVATTLSHPWDTFAADSTGSAQWWFGFLPRLGRQLCVGVSLSFWVVLCERATAFHSVGGSGGSGPLTSSSLS
jgi:hypothetical protein